MEINLDKALETLSNKIDTWFTELVSLLPNLILATIIGVIGIFIARKIKTFVNNKIKRFFPTQTLADLFTNLIYVFLMLIVIFTALKVIGLDDTIKSALAGAGIIGLGLAFAFQDIAANFISGIFLAFRKPFHQKEIIRVKDIEGFVEEVKLRDTTVRTYQAQLVIIPNKEVFQNPITNYTRLGKRRADIKAGISKQNDLRKAQEIAMEALKNVDKIIYEDCQVIYREIKGNTTYFVAECWVNSGVFQDYKVFINDCIIAIDEAFKNHSISMLNEEVYLAFNDSAENISAN